MPKELVPEMHDVGKLLDNRAIRSERSDISLSSHCFVDRNDRPLPLSSLGLPEPHTATWAGIVYHHEAGLDKETNLGNPGGFKQALRTMERQLLYDLVCLILADHLAASTSRPVPQDDRPVGRGSGAQWPRATPYRLCLWRDDASQYPKPGPLIASVRELSDLLAFLSSDPDAQTFYKRYEQLLGSVPEEKGFPMGVTALRTHCELVGKCYRVLHSVIQRTEHSLSYAGNAQQTYGGMEQTWRFRLAECRVVIPALLTPARVGDLGIFQRVESAMGAIRNDQTRRDHLLLDTFETFWLFLPLEEVRPLADVIRPLLDKGFHVKATVREAPLTNLTRWKDFENSAREDPYYFQSDLPGQIRPPLCEVCQLAPGSRQWQKGPEDVVEHLCGICYDTRQQYSERFVKLGQWQDGYTAWLRVFLDFGILDQHLRELFEKFVARAGEGKVSLGEQKRLVESLRTTALTVDYVNDFLAMQADLAANVRKLFSDDNVEELTSQRKELLVVRLERRSDVLRLLHLCYTTALRHFPNSMSAPPFRIAVSVAPVRFPFGEHWRLLHKADHEVAAYLPGGGRLICRLEVIPGIVAQERDRGFRRGMFRLADLALQSPVLARVALQDREERDLADAASKLSRLGLDFESMATFARLLRE